MIGEVRERVLVWAGERLGPRDRRALRWGGLALLPAILWAVVLRPWLGAVEERRDRLSSLRTLAGAEAELLATGDRYPTAVEERARRLAAFAPRLLDRRSEGRAAAEVHQLVEDRARAARVRLTAVEPAGTEPASSRLAAVTLEVQGESDLRGVLDFVSSIESADKLLRVPRLRVRSARDRSDHQVLAFRARIVGYVLDLDADGAPSPTAGHAAAPGTGVETGGSAAGALVRREGGR